MLQNNANMLQNEAQTLKNEKVKMDLYAESMKNDQERFINHLDKINAFMESMTQTDQDWRITQPDALLNVNNSLKSIVFGVVGGGTARTV